MNIIKSWKVNSKTKVKEQEANRDENCGRKVMKRVFVFAVMGGRGEGEREPATSWVYYSRSQIGQGNTVSLICTISIQNSLDLNTSRRLYLFQLNLSPSLVCDIYTL